MVHHRKGVVGDWGVVWGDSLEEEVNPDLNNKVNHAKGVKDEATHAT